MCARHDHPPYGEHDHPAYSFAASADGPDIPADPPHDFGEQVAIRGGLPRDLAARIDAHGSDPAAAVRLEDGWYAGHGRQDAEPPASAEPWPPRDVVQKLADATDHLLNEHRCDMEGYESVGTALTVAREWLATPPASAHVNQPGEWIYPTSGALNCTNHWHDGGTTDAVCPDCGSRRATPPASAPIGDDGEEWHAHGGLGMHAHPKATPPASAPQIRDVQARPIIIESLLSGPIVDEAIDPDDQWQRGFQKGWNACLNDAKERAATPPASAEREAVVVAAGLKESVTLRGLTRRFGTLSDAWYEKVTEEALAAVDALRAAEARSGKVGA